MTGVLLVLSTCVEGRRKEFEEWYEGVHVPEILALPTFRSATRYRLNGSIPATSTLEYLALYQVSDTMRAAQELGAADLTSSAALDLQSVVRGFYDELG